MNQPATVTARVTQSFSVSAERVFDAWLDPALIGKFMFGPLLRDEEIVSLHVDARVGGSFSFVVRRNGQLIDHIGHYLELDRPRRLAFTWAVGGAAADKSHVIIEITPTGDTPTGDTPTSASCDLTLSHELPAAWADFVERSRAAWAKMATALADTLSQTATVERSIWINASLSRAWQAVTQVEFLDQWYATRFRWEIPVLAVGATVKFHNSATEELLATITVLDEPRQFTLHWQTEPPIITTFLLQEEVGGTRAAIIESVYGPMNAEESQQWIDAVGGGYALSMENLQALLEGRSLPH